MSNQQELPLGLKPSKLPTLQKLKAENKKLQSQMEEFKNLTLNNSLGSLVQGALGSSNITSFNPIIQNNIYAPLTINWMLLTYMYKTHGIIQTAIDMPVLDAIRGGLELKSGELSADELKELEDDIEELGVLDTIGEAVKWARLYGGGALLFNTGEEPGKPLDLTRVKKLQLYAANRWELGSAQRVSETYDFYGIKLDASHVLTIKGKEAPYIIRWQLAGWGMSEVERMVEDFNRYLKTNDVLYELIHEAKLDVYRLKGLNSQLVSSAGTNQTRARIQLMNEVKNFQDAIVMDMEDEYEQKQLTFSGLAEITKENRMSIAGALRMPMSKLFGIGAQGFGSGEDDIENYNAMVESEIRQPMRKPIRKVLKIMCLMKFGYEADIQFAYEPLRVLSAVEEEGVKTSRHNRYLADYDRGLLDSHEYGMIAEKEELIPIETEAAKGTLDPHPAPAESNDGGDDGGESDE